MILFDPKCTWCMHVQEYRIRVLCDVTSDNTCKAQNNAHNPPTKQDICVHVRVHATTTSLLSNDAMMLAISMVPTTSRPVVAGDGSPAHLPDDTFSQFYAGYTASHARVQATILERHRYCCHRRGFASSRRPVCHASLHNQISRQQQQPVASL